MHNYVFDPETNGILLLDSEVNPVACKEPRPVYVYHIITEGTLDPVVLSRLQSKRKVQDLLLEYLKNQEIENE